MGLFGKKKKKKKDKAAKPSVVNCAPERSWIEFHTYDATLKVDADKGDVTILAVDVARKNQTFKTNGDTAKFKISFDKTGSTFDVRELRTASDDQVFFVEEVSA